MNYVNIVNCTVYYLHIKLQTEFITNVGSLQERGQTPMMCFLFFSRVSYYYCPEIQVQIYMDIT